MASYLRTSTAKRMPYRKRVSSEADKWVFLVFFILGAASIVGLKIAGFHQLIVTFVPVGILLLYGLGTLFLKRFQLREDQTGDNCYYLGFLYTLVSLAFALYLFQTHETGTEAIITNFGIALCTTIAGLFLRVFINQFRQDPVEIEREARLELGEAASLLRGELDSAVLDLNSFRRSLEQSIEEAVSETNKRTAAALEANTQSVERLSTVSSEVIEALNGLRGRITAIEVPAGLISEKLRPVVEELTEAIEAVAARSKEDEKAIRQITRTVDKAMKAAETWEARLESFGEKADEVSAFVREVSGLPAQLRAGLTALSESVAAQERILGQARTAATESADESRKAFGQVGEAAGEMLALLRRHNQAMEQELRRALQQTAQVEESLSTLVTTLADRLGADGPRERGRPRIASE